ncbi:conserved hypothetical protein [Ricinus communis]|uniref:Uncharacterized protein n=2 Tax=Ricinus communis TaxID=3988 RepID=B9SEM2_RICCO|nr:conserved hypothetical protein [Ricinus communis]
MHRSSSGRGSDEFSLNLSQDAVASSDLPMHISNSDITKKEIGLHRKSIGENAVHLIPIVLILCALALWIFSHPTEPSEVM